jgi:hypothetical protein
MRQSIEKQQETKPTRNSVTVMFHDRNEFLGVIDSFHVRGGAAPALSDALTVDVPVVSPVPSLPSLLKVSAFRAYSRHRTRRRASPRIEKFSAEVLRMRSAWFVFRANPNSRSQAAVAIANTTMTEQHRCAAV